MAIAPSFLWKIHPMAQSNLKHGRPFHNDSRHSTQPHIVHYKALYYLPGSFIGLHANTRGQKCNWKWDCIILFMIRPFSVTVTLLDIFWRCRCPECPEEHDRTVLACCVVLLWLMSPLQCHSSIFSNVLGVCVISNAKLPGRGGGGGN